MPCNPLPGHSLSSRSPKDREVERNLTHTHTTAGESSDAVVHHKTCGDQCGVEPLAVFFANPVCAAGRRDDDATSLLNAGRLVGSLGLVILQEVRSDSTGENLPERSCPGSSGSPCAHGGARPGSPRSLPRRASCSHPLCSLPRLFYPDCTNLVFDTATSPRLLPTPSVWL